MDVVKLLRKDPRVQKADGRFGCRFDESLMGDSRRTFFFGKTSDPPRDDLGMLNDYELLNMNKLLSELLNYNSTLLSDKKHVFLSRKRVGAFFARSISSYGGRRGKH